MVVHKLCNWLIGLKCRYRSVFTGLRAIVYFSRVVVVLLQQMYSHVVKDLYEIDFSVILISQDIREINVF